MKPTKQKIRRSQFVLVYGPGSIIEGPDGSRLMPSFEGLGEKNCNTKFFRKYQIKDVRMSHMLNEENKNKRFNHRFLSIPSNDSIDDDKTQVIYSTVMFPVWHLCYRKKTPILYYDDYKKDKCDAFDKKECEECNKDKNPNVRFVRACPNGHLDEIDWNKEVHGNEICSNSSHFYWKSLGSSLEDIIIECPSCHSSTTMQEIYKKRTKCTSRYPEKEELNGFKINYTSPIQFGKCGEEMSVIQKQSSSLRLPNTKTLLKIPNFDESVLNLFNNPQVISYLEGLKFTDFNALSNEQLNEIINAIREKLKQDEHKEFEEYIKENTLSDFYEEFKNIEKRDTSFSNALDEEFHSIRHETDESKNYSRTDFIPYSLKKWQNFPLKVCAIDKLTTVTAQISYERKPHPKKDKKTGEIIDSEKVYVGYVDDTVDPPEVWYPAFKGVGEGIFITSKENPFEYKDSLEDTIEQWETYNANVSPERPEIENPLFVWWHTLSHALMKSISLFCGYSSASLRERVYLNGDTEEGGILIYNTSPGDDGGMGGLVDLALNRDEFEKVLNNTMDTLFVCSNDPLCSSVKLDSKGVNGSACHNCLFVSETSCEHQNKLLDRNFFLH